jgi:hypothetical protein
LGIRVGDVETITDSIFLVFYLYHTKNLRLHN